MTEPAKIVELKETTFRIVDNTELVSGDPLIKSIREVIAVLSEDYLIGHIHERGDGKYEFRPDQGEGLLFSFRHLKKNLVAELGEKRWDTAQEAKEAVHEQAAKFWREF